MATPLRVFSRAEVAAHNKPDDAYIIVGNKVLDVSKFAALHPGGARVIRAVAGQDATNEFEAAHNPSVLRKHAPRLQVGVLSVEAEKEKPKQGFGVVEIPFAEPYWYYGKLATPPFYTESHVKFRALMRNFVDNEILPFAHQWDEEQKYPEGLQEKAYAAGVYGALWPKEYGGTPPEKRDVFHDLIYYDELARCASGGVIGSVFFATTIALPPVLYGARAELKREIAESVISGKKGIALAITEPYAGSDVAHIRTTAKREGDVYIVNGEKKFITAGCSAAYFTTAVRTGGEGSGATGVSVLLIPSSLPGITVRRMKTQGWWASNTAYITFDNVRVSAGNLLGEEGEGFLIIMKNFNYERWSGGVMNNRNARVCLEDSVRYARVRKTFGKRLIDHQVIRHKVAEMARQIETTHLLIEHITYQMANKGSAASLGLLCGLLKVQSSRVLEFCAREASQILGGACFVRGGQGVRIERIYREVRVAAIGAGSEEVMNDLITRQAKL